MLDRTLPRNHMKLETGDPEDETDDSGSVKVNAEIRVIDLQNHQVEKMEATWGYLTP
ncbi:hypothetical protein K402DRAFT_398829 [Aulographum hederae CBS 113979]|uniref:Uncharacterized protein n=1 Tax=Aulographum hederae CBS 113979 TaxID=1176131 RepID=A0A6G1GJV1_9PEZI|nr:hypothetical protein K402DRAFT_398829 [Aulographum hederae CBS 113979]